MLFQVNNFTMISKTLLHWKSAGYYFEWGKHAIFYRDQGKGEVLLCIHGFPTASFDWHRMWPSLTKHFRVISLDLLGFGFSSKPRRHVYSILEQATIIEALLASLGIDRVHILAHDLGDSIAQECLARHQVSSKTPAFDIQSICFLNGGLFPEAHRPRLIQTLLRGPLGPLLVHGLNEKKFNKSFASVFGENTQPEEQDLADFWNLVERNNGHKLAHRLLQYIPERRQHRDHWLKAMQSTRVPMRLIDGVDDPVSGRHLLERYRELIPDADVVELEGIGHYPQIEAPGAVLAAFLDFHKKLP
jgi:pimeloyl-ACP methyl ester carboxylesterase